MSEDNSSSLKPILFAFIALILAVGAVFLLYPHRQSQLAVTHTELFAPHTESTSDPNAAGMKVIGAPGSIEDDSYLAVTLKLDNKLHVPMYFVGVTATATLADGQQVDATVVSSHTDLNNVQTTFPPLRAMLPHPLHDGDEAPAGKALEGQVLLLFANMKAEQWKTRKSASLMLNLMHQEPMTVALP